MKTILPTDAPRVYARSLLGRHTEKWMRRRGWLMPRPADQAARAYRIAELSPAPAARVDVKA
jgi:hypothetical protein